MSAPGDESSWYHLLVEMDDFESSACRGPSIFYLPVSAKPSLGEGDRLPGASGE